MFRRNNRTWRKCLVYKSSSVEFNQVILQTRWHSKIISKKGYLIPRDFSWTENYKLKFTFWKEQEANWGKDTFLAHKFWFKKSAKFARFIAFLLLKSHEIVWYSRGSEFSGYELELRNRVTQNDTTLMNGELGMVNSKFFI